jgi:tRNA-specific 2-thiouridylase
MLADDGTELGRHEGLAFYTIGQRSGIGIGGRAGSGGDAWYVAAKDPERNALVVVQGRGHRLLWADSLEADAPRWINGPPGALASGAAMPLHARIRHRHAMAGCTLMALPDGRLCVTFDEPQWAVTPGQYVVFYDGPECIGGAVIERAIRYNPAPPGPERLVAQSHS